MTNHFPRTLLVLLLVIIPAAFLVGTSRGAPVVSIVIVTPTLTEEQLSLQEQAPTPTPSMISVEKPADTTGMVIGAALVTLIVLAGAFWGWRNSLPRKPRPPRPPRPSKK